jgi:WD40 repeat protein
MHRHPHLRLILSLLTTLALAAAAHAQQRVLKAPPIQHRGYVAISPDGKLLACGGGGNPELRLLEIATGKTIWSIQAHDKGILRLAFSPDGKTLATCGPWGNPKVRLWDCANGKLLREYGNNIGGTSGVLFSPDGKTLASVQGGAAVLWDVKTGQEKQRFLGPYSIDSAAFSPKDPLLALANGDQKVRLWDFNTGKLVRELPAGQMTATGSQAVAFSSDGKTLATAGIDGKVRLWDVATGNQVREFGADKRWIFGIAFAADGKTVATAESDLVRLWDADTGKQLRQWPGEGVWYLAFLPDSRTLTWYAGDRIVLQAVPKD